MSFLGSFGKALGIGNINKSEAFKIASVAFPPLGISVAAGNALSAVGNKLMSMQTQKAALPGDAGSSFNIYSSQYHTPDAYYYASPPAYSTYFSPGNFGGETPWDSLTLSTAYSTPTLDPVVSSVPSSMSSQGRPWEDFLADSLNRR